jgi:signal transduction histidine kinase
MSSNDEPHRVLFDSIGGGSHAIALWAILQRDGGPRIVYGVAANPDVLQSCFASLIGGAQLLPGLPANETLTGDDIAVRLTRSDGTPVFTTNRPIGRTAATDSTELQLGELRATVDLSPRVASLLLRGGAPPSQLPALALMIAISAVLAIVALRHQRHLRELQRVREQFVANVSHELRTPLAQISMFAETLALERERNPAERRQFASIMFAEARRLTALVESVLRFSRTGAKREPSVLEAHPLHQEIDAVVQAFMPIAAQSDASVIATHTGDPHVRLDRDGFRQIMLNLLENAVKHGGRGTAVEVTTRTSAGEVHIAVDDDGPGVPPEWRERVFEPFERVDGTQVAGAGIGLAVVRDIVVAHGGRIWIEHSPRGGARFVIALPVAPATDRARRPDAPATTGA